MYRRRDSQNGRTAYSSADAYRSLNSNPSTNAAPNDSSEDESQLQRNASTPIADNFARRRSTDSTRNNAPLIPPRPFFLEGGARQSWSASSESTSLTGEQSDSDSAPPARKPSADATTRPSQRGAAARSIRSLTDPTQPAQPVSSSNPRPRTRNHRRRSSVANEYAPEPESEDVTVAASPTLSPVIANTPTSATPFIPNPFDTPRNSFYGAMPVGAAPPLVAGPRPPPSSFPFQSHPGNPDPGLPLPGMGRRASIESIRARESTYPHGHQHSPSTGTVYPAGAGVAGYGLLSHGGASSSDLAGDLGRPYAPFMEYGVPSREGSATPPSPMGSRIYMNSAAAAMAGSSQALNQGFGKLRSERTAFPEAR
ncbi:hypothetical protein BD311DRAFT_381534 [Dichomitus squalens]|uniref:Uncharacterized protein n=1 Tax=Dichomitus squalens TaxID=114155 RepID=A0A4Q9MII7_9APHY|nr:hypothetical protein BD311DRAFT_381534 [Dichomitus squalens]